MNKSDVRLMREGAAGILVDVALGALQSAEDGRLLPEPLFLRAGKALGMIYLEGDRGLMESVDRMHHGMRDINESVREGLPLRKAAGMKAVREGLLEVLYACNIPYPNWARYAWAGEKIKVWRVVRGEPRPAFRSVKEVQK